MSAYVGLVPLQPVQVAVALEWIATDVEFWKGAIDRHGRYAEGVRVKSGDAITEEIDPGDVWFLEERVGLDLWNILKQIVFDK